MDCRKCKWYRKQEPYAFGICVAPIPGYFSEAYQPNISVISTSENYAPECEVYGARDDA